MSNPPCHQEPCEEAVESADIDEQDRDGQKGIGRRRDTKCRIVGEVWPTKFGGKQPEMC